jgi:voltage-gated potassium channel
LELREKLKFLLEDMETWEGKFTSLSLVFLNSVFVLIYIVDTYPISQQFYQMLWSLEIGITGVFILEYAARVYTSDKSFFEKVLEPLMIADFLAILPVLLILVGPGASVSAGFLKVFRVFRVFRFLRLTESRNFIWGKVSRTDLQILKFATVIFALFFVTSGFFYEVEVEANPNVETLRDSLYYMVVTLTTVGFGDITPVTPEGRWITILSIMAGVVIIPWQASRIVKTWNSQEKIETKCPECGLKHHDPDASHCKACGHVIEQEYDSRQAEYL